MLEKFAPGAFKTQTKFCFFVDTRSYLLELLGHQ